MNIHGLEVNESNIQSVFIFALAVKAGSFASIAESNGISKSKISRHVFSLEEQLGEVLINRSTRRFQPTEKAISISDAILSIGSAKSATDSAFSRGYKKGEKDGRAKGLSEAIELIKNLSEK